MNGTCLEGGIQDQAGMEAYYTCVNDAIPTTCNNRQTDKLAASQLWREGRDGVRPQQLAPGPPGHLPGRGHGWALERQRTQHPQGG